MMASNSTFEFGAVCMGAVGSTASWRRERAAIDRPGRWPPMVVVQTCSATDEGSFTPAESVTIGGHESLLALREAIDEALKHYEKREATFTAQQVADACCAAEIPDSKCESVLLALRA